MVFVSRRRAILFVSSFSHCVKIMAVFFATYFLAQLFVSHKIINNLLFLSLFSQIVAFFIKTFYSLWLLYFLFPLFHCRTYLYSLFWCMLGVLERIWKKSLNWEKFIMVSMASFWHICNNIGFDRGGGGLWSFTMCVCVCRNVCICNSK